MSRNAAGGSEDEAVVPACEAGVTTAEELSYRLHQQEVLAQFGLFVAPGRHSLDDILAEAVRIGAEGLEVRFCKVLELLTGAEAPRLLVRAGVGWAAGVVGHATLGADLASPAGFALRTGRPVISNHLAQESRFRTPKLLAEHGVTRAINVLIPAGGEPFGVLEADCSRAGRHFSERDVAFLQTLAAMVGSAIDGHAAQRRMAESENRFRATFEQAAVGIAHVGLDGRWLRVNARLCEIAGYTDEELRRTDFQAITHPADLATDLDLLRRLLAGEIDTCAIEKRYVRKSGEPVWVNLTVSLVRDEQGRRCTSSRWSRISTGASGPRRHCRR